MSAIARDTTVTIFKRMNSHEPEIRYAQSRRTTRILGAPSWSDSNRVFGASVTLF